MEGGNENKCKALERSRKQGMDTIEDILEIIKDLIEIVVLILTARQLIKHKKSKKSRKKK